MRQYNGSDQAYWDIKHVEYDASRPSSAVLAGLSPEMAPKECADTIKAGDEFVREASKDRPGAAPCLLISGQLGYYPDDESLLFENRVRQSCLDTFGYPPQDPDNRQAMIDVLLDSGGGMLDSAFKITLYLFRYAKEERASKISYRLVYGYTHHPFPIDYDEARRIGLEAHMMGGTACAKADRVVELCGDKAFVGFVSKDQADAEATARAARKTLRAADRKAPDGHKDRKATPAMAYVETPTASPYDDPAATDPILREKKDQSGSP